jgi:type IV secretion system protein VirD4
MGRKMIDRSLQGVRELCSPERLERAIEVLQKSDDCDGMLARLGDQCQQYTGTEKQSVLTTLNRHLSFLDSPLIANSTRSSSFDPAALKDGGMSAYFIAPMEFVRSNPSLVRMWLGCAIERIQSRGLDERNKVHVVIDEAATLKKFDCIENVLTTGRSSGLRCHLIYQSLPQLRESFPNGADGNVCANTTQVIWSVNDATTAEHLSIHAGDFTAIVDSGGTNTGNSRSVSQGGQSNTSTSGSYGSSSSWGQQARRLIKSEEVRTLPGTTAITLQPNMPPVMTNMVRYFEEKNLGRGESWFSRLAAGCAMLAVSIVFLGLALIVATALTDAFNDGKQQSLNAPAATQFGGPMRH